MSLRSLRIVLAPSVTHSNDGIQLDADASRALRLVLSRQLPGTSAAIMEAFPALRELYKSLEPFESSFNQPDMKTGRLPSQSDTELEKVLRSRAERLADPDEGTPYHRRKL